MIIISLPLRFLWAVGYKCAIWKRAKYKYVDNFHVEIDDSFLITAKPKCTRSSENYQVREILRKRPLTAFNAVNGIDYRLLDENNSIRVAEYIANDFRLHSIYNYIKWCTIDHNMLLESNGQVINTALRINIKYSIKDPVSFVKYFYHLYIKDYGMKDMDKYYIDYAESIIKSIVSPIISQSLGILLGNGIDINDLKEKDLYQLALKQSKSGDDEKLSFQKKQLIAAKNRIPDYISIEFQVE